MRISWYHCSHVAAPMTPYNYREALAVRLILVHSILI